MFADECKYIILYDSTKLYSLAVITNTYYVNALTFYYVDIYNHYVFTIYYTCTFIYLHDLYFILR